MSKIKVNEIESSSTDVKLAAKGTGVVKVQGAGGNDGTLKLSAGTNGIKIRSPAHSAGQSYTMILPDNDIEAGKFLHVDSITGSGTTAVGQLKYTLITEPDVSSLSASNVTSGTMDAARFGTTLPAASGALKLVSTHQVTSSVTNIQISLDVGRYLLIGKAIEQNQGSTHIRLHPLNESGSDRQITGEYFTWGTGTEPQQFSLGTALYWNIQPATTPESWHTKIGFIAEIDNRETYPTIFARGQFLGNSAYADAHFYELYGSFMNQDERIYTLKITSDVGSSVFTNNTKLLLYKYGET